METKYGFTKMTIAEFASWLKNLRVSRTILKIQQHHTYSPSYILFTGSNHFERQKAMKDYHINNNGWNDIGQHFTVFPDGTIMTRRSIEKSPACIYGQNANSVCIENFGDFDIDKDAMTQEQRQAIVMATALLCQRFHVPVTTNNIIYHHWYDLSTGVRNNGTRNNKSCPGTNFFGGNKVADCQNNFLPLVMAILSEEIKTESTDVVKYVCVNTSSLNVRTEPNASSPRAPERPAVVIGSILRIYEQQGDWLKISKSDSRWVAARYTTDVRRAIVTASSLNVRSGPSTTFPKIDSLPQNEIVFISQTHNNWSRLGLEDRWVNHSYLKVEN